MSDPTPVHPSRRDVLQTSAGLAVASTLAGLVVPHVHAANDETIRVALVGCGGRGTGAVEDALNTTLKTKLGPTKLVAMADAFEDRLKDSYRELNRDPYSQLVEVHEDHKFVGYDAYKKVMDCLKRRDGLALAPLRLCRQQGPARLHGEARDGGRPHLEADVRPDRGVEEEGPQG